MDTRQMDPQDARMNAENLYLEEAITDRRVGRIRRLRPITVAGEPDPSRDPLFVAEAHVMTPAGPIPIEAPIDATTLEGAMEGFAAAVQQAMDELVSQLREMERERAGRIIVPDALGGMPGGMPGGPGGFGGLIKP